MNKGKIIAIHGIVVEFEFQDTTPEIYEAVKTTGKNSNDQKVVFEILQQLGDGKVR